MEKVFFELIQVALRRREALSRIPTPEEWELLYSISKKQALMGIAFKGVERLPKEQLPPPGRVRQWSLKADRLVDANKRVCQECQALHKMFRSYGFDAYVLKGQSNMAYYDDGVGMYRASGDIDVWVMSCDRTLRHPIKGVIEFCQKLKKGEYIYYHNLDFPVLRNTPVEVHYRPTWLFAPFKNSVLQRWFKVNMESTEYQGFNILSLKFNVVFQLLHIYKHIFEEGIGLRQLLDYYFVLKAFKENDGDKVEILALLRKIGMMKFCGAVMYVLREVFNTPEELLLCGAREKEGVQLLNDILAGGNFGKYDESKKWELQPDSGIVVRTMYAIQKIKHNMRYLDSYPEEVMWELPFRFYHWAWRCFRLWRWE